MDHNFGWPPGAGYLPGAPMLDQTGRAVNWLPLPAPWWLWPVAPPPPSFEHNDYLPPGLRHPHGRDPKTPDDLGPLPPWAADGQKPWKAGQPRAAWIWPRDKHSKTPLSSWTRWKDVVTGQGPPVYVGDRTKFGPTKDQWSRWVELDNFGYRTGERHINKDPLNRKYDFRRRRFTDDPWRRGVWSGVQRPPRGRGDGLPNMIRDVWGNEWTNDAGWIPDGLPWLNKHRYNVWSSGWDYFSPQVVDA